LVTGTDTDGRSYVVEELDVGPTLASPDFERHEIYRSPSMPPPPRPQGHGEEFPMGIEPGQMLWYLTWMGPGVVDVPFHHTDTVDIGLVLDGSIELILADGAHLLRAGDSFVVNGDDHSWLVGPDGCRLCSASIGTHPPAI
jgi:hypothetical protein